jgi:hypothetical protein
MKRKPSFSFLSIILMLCFFPSTSLATKWVYPFVVWDGYIYVVKDEVITEIDKEIGEVTKYSDMRELPGNFSNEYEKGTKYYSIQGISTDQSIAVEAEPGKYIKADREKKYMLGAAEEQSHLPDRSAVNLLVLFTIIAWGTIYVMKRIRK